MAYKVKKDPKLYLMMAEPDITADDLAKIKVPTVVIAGEKDLVLLEETKRIAAGIDVVQNSASSRSEGHGNTSFTTRASRTSSWKRRASAMLAPEFDPDCLDALKTAQQGEIDAVLMYRSSPGS